MFCASGGRPAIDGCAAPWECPRLPARLSGTSRAVPEAHGRQGRVDIVTPYPWPGGPSSKARHYGKPECRTGALTPVPISKIGSHALAAVTPRSGLGGGPVPIAGEQNTANNEIEF